MSRILPPHEDQTDWVYVRVPKHYMAQMFQIVMSTTFFKLTTEIVLVDEVTLTYPDDKDGSRVISSARTEESVETCDWLKRCEAEGLVASYDGFVDEWLVMSREQAVAWIDHGTPIPESSVPVAARTVRAAYEDYRRRAAE